MWIYTKNRLPDINKKYLVIINCNGYEKESYCSFIKSKNRFHFDMPHIGWKVVKWFDLNKY